MCAQPDFPGIYTDVTKFRSWIAANKSPAMTSISGVAMLMSVIVATILGMQR